MSAATPPDLLLDAVRAAIAFESVGDAAGNVTMGRGRLDGTPVHAALVQNRTASGAIGVAEARRLGALLTVAARERAAVVLHLESAGAKVSEGLAALGAFRRVYADALQALVAGARLAVVLGRNCYGGSSMLAHIAPRRLLAPESRLGMSGPSVLAAGAGMDVLDDAFRAMVEATIGAPARVRASPSNTLWEPGLDVAAWLREAFAAADDPAIDFRSRHEALQRRLEPREGASAAETVHRRDLERIYPEGHDARESAGLLVGEGKVAGDIEPFVGLVGKASLGAERAWRFAQAAWRHVDSPPKRLRIYLDCATQAARLEDERVVLSEYIVGMSLPLALLALRGTRVELTVLGQAGGGVYVALAGPAHHVSAVHGADIQMLPGAAITAILGEGRDTPADPAQWRAAGVAEEELKLGLMPGG